MSGLRWMAALLALLFGVCGASAEEGYYEEMPELLRVWQKTETEMINSGAGIRRTYPTSANTAVDGEIRALVDALVDRNRDRLPKGTRKIPAYLDVGAVISRTGTSFMSFLTLAEISHEHEQLSVEFDARVYDMETGERVALTDIFPEASEAWAMLSRAVRVQLSEAFPEETPDEDALDALCEIQAIQSAPFILGAARLSLVYRADAVYPGKQTLLHVTMDYAELRPYMTERARAQTDNSRFRKVALTYDDGGALVYTRNVLDVLRRHGASATFFVVGRRSRNNHHNLCRQQDAGYSIQSHTYTHRYPKETTRAEKWEEKEQMARELSAVTGALPAMMRAPGGMENAYLRMGIGYPLIHWSLAAGDSGNPHADQIAEYVIKYVRNGDVVLLHDINPVVGEYSEEIVKSLIEQGFLLVTVEELFADAGIPLTEGNVYYSTRRVESGLEAK